MQYLPFCLMFRRLVCSIRLSIRPCRSMPICMPCLTNFMKSTAYAVMVSTCLLYTSTLGDKDLNGLVADIKQGILVTGFNGGNSNSSTGDFSYGIEGFLICLLYTSSAISTSSLMSPGWLAPISTTARSCSGRRRSKVRGTPM